MVGISFYSEVYNCNQTKEGEMNYEEENIVRISAYFSFNGYGVSRRQFEAYVEKVKTKFSDIETDDSDIKYFEAKNNNGDEIELSYYTEIQVRVTKKLADIQ